MKFLSKIGIIYAVYQEKTLEETAKQFKILPQKLKYHFNRLGLKKNKRKKVIKRGKKVKTFNNKKYMPDYLGRYRSTTKPQTFLKRDVWEYYNGKLLPNTRLYLKDGNENNCKIENIKLYSKMIK